MSTSKQLDLVEISSFDDLSIAMGFSSSYCEPSSVTGCLLYNCNAAKRFLLRNVCEYVLTELVDSANEPINVVKTTYRVDGCGKSLRGLVLDSSVYEGLGLQTRVLEGGATKMNCQKPERKHLIT